MRILFITLVIITVLTGCSQNSSEKDTYPGAVMWNDILFGLSRTEVPSQEINKELGMVHKMTNPMPQNNGESNDTPVGSLILEIKGIDPNEAIAVKNDNIYYKATKLFSNKDN